MADEDNSVPGSKRGKGLFRAGHRRNDICRARAVQRSRSKSPPRVRNEPAISQPAAELSPPVPADTSMVLLNYPWTS